MEWTGVRAGGGESAEGQQTSNEGHSILSLAGLAWVLARTRASGEGPGLLEGGVWRRRQREVERPTGVGRGQPGKSKRRSWDVK